MVTGIYLSPFFSGWSAGQIRHGSAVPDFLSGVHWLSMTSTLVTGALGQMGSELVPALRERYGADRVVASDIRMPPIASLSGGGRFEFIDCTNPRQVQDVVRVHDVGTIYHLAALLSATAEEKPHI